MFFGGLMNSHKKLPQGVRVTSGWPPPLSVPTGDGRVVAP